MLRNWKGTLLYIAGYSRCGSTILDMVLDAHASITSAGELTYLLDDACDFSRECTCSAVYAKCPGYGDWLACGPKDKTNQIRRIETRENFDHLLAGQVTTEDRVAYYEYANILLEYLQQRTSCRIVLASSKSARDAAGRPLAMPKLAGLDVRVLHLFRSPDATMSSFLERGPNWELEKHKPAATLASRCPIVGWTPANRITLQIGSEIGSGKYLHIRFEDFLSDPTSALGRLEALIDTDIQSLAASVLRAGQFCAGHNAGGNRARLEPQRVKLSQAPSRKIPFRYALALKLVAQRTARRLGYHSAHKP